MESASIGIASFGLLLAFALTAAGFFIAMASKRSVHWGLIAAGAVLPIVAIVAVPNLLHALTGGKAALGETMPWVAFIAPIVPIVWLRWRTQAGARNSSTAPRAGRKPASNRPQQESAAKKPADQAATPIIFISYRRDDSADVTGRLYDRLASAFGRERVHKDVDSIPLGVDFVEHINELISECDVVLAVIGRRWLNATGSNNDRRLDDATDPVRLEIVAALDRGIPVVPVLVSGSTIPPADALPDDIRKLAFRNGTKVRPDPDFHKDVDRLIAGLSSH